MIQITGRKIESDNEVFVNKDNEVFAFPRKIDPFQISARINPEEYALVQEGNLPNYQSDLAISMNQGFEGLKHVDANRVVLKNGLKVPTPSIFLPHYFNVNEALERRTVLYDASGNLIEGERLRKYADTLNYNCWSRLNAMFPKAQEKDTGFLGLDLAVITGFDSKDNPIFSRSPLEDCLERDCWAEVESANSQGLPTKRSSIEKYIPGKVIRFLYPRKDEVTGFRADSDGADMDCFGGPQYSDASFGVFLCAEGAQKSAEEFKLDPDTEYAIIESHKPMRFER